MAGAAVTSLPFPIFVLLSALHAMRKAQHMVTIRATKVYRPSGSG